MSTWRTVQPSRQAQSYIQPATRHSTPGPSRAGHRRLLQAARLQPDRFGPSVLGFDPVARSAANPEHIRPSPTEVAERSAHLEFGLAVSAIHPGIFFPAHRLA